MRQIKKRRYIVTLIITLFIFFFGTMLGILMEGQRVQYIQEKTDEQKLDYMNLQFQYEFINQLREDANCPLFIKTLNSNIRTLEETRARLTAYDLDAVVSKHEFDSLYQDYILSQLNYWLLAKDARDLCQLESARILYFFSNDKECDSCEEQAFILTYLKNKLGDRLLNFALNAEFKDNQALKLVMDSYSISVFPTLVIEDVKFEGLTSKQEILQEICKYYNESIDLCEEYGVLTES
ncbi:MAG: hypothetical protein ABH828_05160 [archaeon]